MRKYYPLLIQIGLSLLALVYVIYKVLQFQDWAFFFDQLIIKQRSFIFLLLIQLLLAGVNISLEAIKWQMLISVLKPQGFSNSFRQVIRGIQFGMLTPARAGEPVGKALLFNKGSRTQALLLSAAGSMIQNIVIILAGVVSSIFLHSYRLLDSSLVFSIQKEILQYGFLIPIVVFFIVLGIYRLIKFLWSNPVFRRISFHLQIYRKLGMGQIIEIFLFTFFRYLVFSFQLWLVLKFFEIIEFPMHIWLIPLYYVIITFIPTIALADLGIRSSIALFVFGVVSTNIVAIITSIFLIWFFNLAIPCLIGIFLLKVKN